MQMQGVKWHFVRHEPEMRSVGNEED